MPKLTLRDLFSLITITAMIVGWWLDRTRLSNEAKQLRVKSMRLEMENSMRESMQFMPPEIRADQDAPAER